MATFNVQVIRGGKESVLQVHTDDGEAGAKAHVEYVLGKGIETVPGDGLPSIGKIEEVVKKD